MSTYIFSVLDLSDASRYVHVQQTAFGWRADVEPSVLAELQHLRKFPALDGPVLVGASRRDIQLNDWADTRYLSLDTASHVAEPPYRQLWSEVMRRLTPVLDQDALRMALRTATGDFNAYNTITHPLVAQLRGAAPALVPFVVSRVAGMPARQADEELTALLTMPLSRVAQDLFEEFDGLSRQLTPAAMKYLATRQPEGERLTYRDTVMYMCGVLKDVPVEAVRQVSPTNWRIVEDAFNVNPDLGRLVMRNPADSFRRLVTVLPSDRRAVLDSVDQILAESLRELGRYVRDGEPDSQWRQQSILRLIKAYQRAEGQPDDVGVNVDGRYPALVEQAPLSFTYAGERFLGTALTDITALRGEAEDMGSCVDKLTYIAKCARGTSFLYSLRGEGGSSYTAEFDSSGNLFRLEGEALARAVERELVHKVKQAAWLCFRWSAASGLSSTVMVRPGAGVSTPGGAARSGGVPTTPRASSDPKTRARKLG